VDDPGVKKGEVDPTETLLQLVRDAIRIGKNPRVSPQDCDLPGQAALRRGNGFGMKLNRTSYSDPFVRLFLFPPLCVKLRDLSCGLPGHEQQFARALGGSRLTPVRSRRPQTVPFP
jgi:hypothetical protein